MNFKAVLLVSMSIVFNVQCLKVTSDGGYSDVVIRIEDDVDSQNCDYTLNNLRSLLTSASRDLSSVLSGEKSFELVATLKYSVNDKIFYG